MVARRPWLVPVTLAAVVACSGKPRPEDATRGATGRGDAMSSSAAASGDAASSDAASGHAAPGDAAARGDAAIGGARGAAGDLQVRVEWPDVPVAARSSPGRTPCHTPRAPSVAPTTTWGIPGALVVVDGGPRSGGLQPGTHITLADCALIPRLAVGTSLAITSAVDRPAKLVLRKRGTVDRLVAGEPVPVLLPIAGHTVTAALEAGAIYSLETDAAEPELAFIAALPEGHVTDATGHALIRDLAPGPHAITAWLPPRAGQPARIGHGTATIVSGELRELIVRLAP